MLKEKKFETKAYRADGGLVRRLRMQERPTVFSAARDGAELALSGMFRIGGKGDGTVISRYDPKSETIAKKDGKIVDDNSGHPIEVKKVLLDGCNYAVWGHRIDHRTLPKNQGRDSPLYWPGEQMQEVAPEISERVAYGSVLEMASILRKNALTAILLHMPADLPPAQVPDIREVRSRHHREKLIHPALKELTQEWGFGSMPVHSGKDMEKDKNALKLVAEGKAVWYELESAFRDKAFKALALLMKKNGLMELTDAYYPGGHEQWERENRRRGDIWMLQERNGVYFVCVSREKKGVLEIPVGTRKKDGRTGSPMCALITSELLLRGWQDLGISHMITACHSDEAQVVSAAFFVARHLFGSPVHSYAVSIGRQTYQAEYGGWNGAIAFHHQLDEETKPY